MGWYFVFVHIVAGVHIASVAGPVTYESCLTLQQTSQNDNEIIVAKCLIGKRLAMKFVTNILP